MERLKYFLLFVGFSLIGLFTLLLVALIGKSFPLSLPESLQELLLLSFREMLPLILFLVLFLIWLTTLFLAGLCLVGSFFPLWIGWAFERLKLFFRTFKQVE